MKDQKQDRRILSPADVEAVAVAVVAMLSEKRNVTQLKCICGVCNVCRNRLHMRQVRAARKAAKREGNALQPVEITRATLSARPKECCETMIEP